MRQPLLGDFSGASELSAIREYAKNVHLIAARIFAGAAAQHYRTPHRPFAVHSSVCIQARVRGADARSGDDCRALGTQPFHSVSVANRTHADIHRYCTLPMARVHRLAGCRATGCRPAVARLVSVGRVCSLRRACTASGKSQSRVHCCIVCA